MATDADVDMGGVLSADEVHNVVPSGTKRKAERLSEGSGAPRRIKVGPNRGSFSPTPHACAAPASAR